MTIMSGQCKDNLGLQTVYEVCTYQMGILMFMNEVTWFSMCSTYTQLPHSVHLGISVQLKFLLVSVCYRGSKVALLSQTGQSDSAAIGHYRQNVVATINSIFSISPLLISPLLIRLLFSQKGLSKKNSDHSDGRPSGQFPLKYHFHWKVTSKYEKCLNSRLKLKTTDKIRVQNMTQSSKAKLIGSPRGNIESGSAQTILFIS